MRNLRHFTRSKRYDLFVAPVYPKDVYNTWYAIVWPAKLGRDITEVMWVYQFHDCCVFKDGAAYVLRRISSRRSVDLILAADIGEEIMLPVVGIRRRAERVAML